MAPGPALLGELRDRLLDQTLRLAAARPTLPMVPLLCCVMTLSAGQKAWDAQRRRQARHGTETFI